MAKKFSLKGAGTQGTVGASKVGVRHKVANPTSSGGNALQSDHWIANDGRQQIKGIATARHHIIKPTGDSGSIGTGQPLKSFKGTGRENQRSDKPLGTVYKKSKPNK